MNKLMNGLFSMLIFQGIIEAQNNIHCINIIDNNAYRLVY